MAEDGAFDEIPQAQRTVRTVEIVDVMLGDLPSIIVAERLRVRGRIRTFTQQVRVRDPILSQRLAQVSKGERIKVVVETEFFEQGYETFLVDFSTLIEEKQ
jgi:hypothetical protein